MSDGMKDFLATGYARYPDACRVIVSFRDEVGARLSTALRRQREWGRFVPARLGTPQWSDRSFWIVCMQSGTLDNSPAKIELGLWWECPEVDAQVILFAGLNEGPGDCRLSDGPSAKFRYREKRDYLYRPVGPDTVLEQVAGDLLTELFGRLPGAALHSPVIADGGGDTADNAVARGP